MATAVVPRPGETVTVGELLRRWRTHRRMSQLDLGTGAGVSTRHLSFVETGRSKPSRELLMHLAEHLDVPLRERNALLLAAGYAPGFSETSLDAPDMAAVRGAVDAILEAHAPYPALAIDVRWDLLAANAGVAAFLAMIPAELLTPPVNVVRVSLHPDGLARLLLNFDEYAGHLVARLRRQHDATGDPGLGSLLAEVLAFPGVAHAAESALPPGIVLPMRLAHPSGVGPPLSMFSTMTVFGAPLDITVAELAIESFFPADEHTAGAFAALGDPVRAQPGA